MFRLWSLLALAGAALAQFPPRPENVTVLQSRFQPGVTISYKEPGICETTPGVKSYAGYVHLPPGTVTEGGQLQNYTINTFFWFFEARKDPLNAPTALWLNGGPGSSSMIGLFQEIGPCYINADSATTRLNEWAWNNEVNMLFIDQPVQTGFSYDTPRNFTVDVFYDIYTELKAGDPIPRQNSSFLVGTFGSGEEANTANTTTNAAHAVWHFTQTWFKEFPAYMPNNSKISLWTESYGGHYGPQFAAFFEEQNDKIASGAINSTSAFNINLENLGIINGLIDNVVQEFGYLEIANNNTYGIKALSDETYAAAKFNLSRPGGCLDQLSTCRDLSTRLDPDNTGGVPAVSKACADAFDWCFYNYEAAFYEANRGVYDIAHPLADPFPPAYYQGYLNRPDVQRAIGTPVNFTQSADSIFYAFSDAGDHVMESYLDEIAYVLDRGVKVALIYGDRDWICNWIGGEAAAFAVNSTKYKSGFAAAGYADVRTNASYNGGLVKQYGNYSFTRVFESGHEVPAYQPETAYRIFMRTMLNRDIATGNVTLTDSYSTSGPASSLGTKNIPPPMPQPECYVLAPSTCTDDQAYAVLNGTVVVKDYIVQDRNTTRTRVGNTNTGAKGKSTAARPGVSSWTLGVGMVLAMMMV